MKNNFLKFSLLACLTIFNVLPVLAGPGGGGTDDGSEYEDLPIDNWVLMLILAGVVIGIYFIAQSKRKAIA